MKKKIFSAALLFTIGLATAGTFVSCSDYDDDISNLQEQIDKLASADELSSKIAEMQSAISSAKTDLAGDISAVQTVANAAKESASTAQSTADAAKKAVDELTKNGATASQVEAAQKAADAAQKTADAAQKAVDDYKTANDTAVKNAVDAAKAAQATADSLSNVLSGLTGDEGAIAAANKAIDEAKQAAANAMTAANKADSIAKAATTAIDAVKGDKYTEDVTLSSLNAQLAAINGVLKIGDAGAEIDLTELNKKVNSIDEQLTKIIGEYSTMVTSVELFYSSNSDIDDQNFALDFKRIIEKTNTFPTDKNIKGTPFTFKEGNEVTYAAEPIIIRVSPTTADLKSEMIHLMNSQGKELTGIVKCASVEPYTDRLTTTTRATAAGNNNGLWKVVFALEDGYSPDDFQAAVNDGKDKYVLFAVAVNNTTSEKVDANRRVISTYDITLKAQTTTDYNDNIFVQNSDNSWNSIDDIQNRSESDGTLSISKSTMEYVWKDTPAVAGDKDNTEVGDDRSGNGTLVAAAVGAPINIKLSYNYKDKTFTEKTQIKGFYVTLDKDYASDSYPSEINAWNSYKYEGLDTLISGNDGSITIKNLNGVKGDIIGFRVYAVNLDGTLVDPDGRSFYVKVGDAPEAPQTIAASIKATSTGTLYSDYMELTTALPSDATLDSEGHLPGWVPDSNNPKYADENYTSPLFTVTYYKDNKGTVATEAKDAKYYRFSVGEIADYINGETYKQTCEIRKTEEGASFLVTTITAVMTKVMPTEGIALKYLSGQTENQVLLPAISSTTGSTTGYDAYKDASSPVSTGSMYLENVIYQQESDGSWVKLYDPNVTLNFATSKKDDKGNYTESVTVTKDADNHFKLTVDAGLIDNATSHAISSTYAYIGVSTYKDAKEGWKVGENWERPCTALNMTYSCWHHKSSDFTWKSDFVKTQKGAGNDNQLQWKSDATLGSETLSFDKTTSTNSYNAELFGTSLYNLLKEKVLATVDKPKFYTAAGEINPYFDVSFTTNSSTAITEGLQFTQKDQQQNQNPQSTVDGYVEFKVKDAFGHEKTVKLNVKVLPAEKK